MKTPRTIDSIDSRCFAIATSWDDDFLAGLVDIQTSTGARFEEIYGAFRQDVIGNGRHAYRLPNVTSDQVAAHIATANRLGIQYVHLLNAPELASGLADREFRARVLASIEALGKLGVRALTIANEGLLRLVLESFASDFRIKLSLIAGVDSVDRARYFEDLGVDVIVLSPFSLNRDFKTLQAIRESVNCELELYANIPCLHRCPVSSEHYRYLGKSTSCSEPLGAEPDPYLQYCTSRFLSDPIELVRSPFIRPEDVDLYFELGIDRLKLSDRAENTAFLLGTASAYAERTYHGNLFALVFRGGSKFRAALGPSGSSTNRPSPAIDIDNDTLTRLGFLDRIVRSQDEVGLDRFYQEAAAAAVSLKDSTLVGWTSSLRESRASHNLKMTDLAKEVP